MLYMRFENEVQKYHLSFNTRGLEVCSSEHQPMYSKTVSLHECAHTHSWPSRSCVRASSGCRSGAHPGRTVSPALWTQLSALPSVCRTASHTCIAPLQRRRRGAKKKTLGSVEHFIKMEGTGAWLYSYQEEVR